MAKKTRLTKIVEKLEDGRTKVSKAVVEKLLGMLAEDVERDAWEKVVWP